MASSGTWGPRAALLLALLSAAGCTKKTDTYPPPRPADTSGSGGGATGGGGGGTSGAGGTAPVPNFCECAYELTYDTGCGDCINDANNLSTGACKVEVGQCGADAGCKAILACPAACSMVPVNQRVACITACFVPFANDASHDLAAAYLSCACAHCAGSCGGSPIVCE